MQGGFDFLLEPLHPRCLHKRHELQSKPSNCPSIHMEYVVTKDGCDDERDIWQTCVPLIQCIQYQRYETVCNMDTTLLHVTMRPQLSAKLQNAKLV